MTEHKLNAARLVGLGKATMPAIAKKVGVSLRTIVGWKNEAAFLNEARKVASEWRAEARGKGIADQDERLRELNDLRNRLRAAIQARGRSKDMENVPGGRSGLVTVTYKTINRVEYVGESAYKVSEVFPEYVIDTATPAAIAALLQQAAVEMGQWKTRNVSEDKKTLDVTPRALALAEIFGCMSSPDLVAIQKHLEALEKAPEA